MHIIVKSKPSHGLFRPHFNLAMGKRYHTKDEYLSDLKRQGLEPQGKVRKVEDKPYVASKWGRDMVEQIKAQRGKAPSGRFLDELDKKGYGAGVMAKRKQKYDSMRKEDGNA